MHRVPALNTQANILGDALKNEFLLEQAPRHKVLDTTARLNGFHSWRHAVALGEQPSARRTWSPLEMLRRLRSAPVAEESAAPQLFVPVPEWVRSLALVDCGWFQTVSETDRMRMFRLLAYAGFSPRLSRKPHTLVEFSRVIAPNSYQAIIPEEDRTARDGETFGVVTTDYIEGDFYAACNVWGDDWPSALRASLLEVETQRAETLENPDAWLAPPVDRPEHLRF